MRWSVRGSQTLLLRRKYLVWRCALVYERLRCEPWMEALGMGGDYPVPTGLEKARAQGLNIALSVWTTCSMSRVHSLEEERTVSATFLVGF